ncbi:MULTISPECIES: hypothetical protein [Carnobacterium]|uniref:hypothetical protein n=1 Tax=Carnobacterium TaxID=2747 RepID=UPI0005590248|nr:hypothetical protein [Carnobacterium inhibens]MCM3512577.1 hypothetical protein [Carnobacterium inhibens]
MKLVITFIDGEQLELCDSSIINGYINVHELNKEYELKKIFSNSFNAIHTNESSMIATSTPQIGYASLIDEADWITIGTDTDFATFYKTSSIKSISRKLL